MQHAVKSNLPTTRKVRK